MEKSLFQLPMKVRDYECDAQGIVNNANYQHYYEVCRHDFLEANGLDFYTLHTEGLDAVVVSVYIRYHHSLRGNDKFICTIDSIEKKGIRYIFNQSIYRQCDGKKCSSACIETACMLHGKVSKPELFDNIFGKYMV